MFPALPCDHSSTGPPTGGRVYQACRRRPSSVTMKRSSAPAGGGPTCRSGKKTKWSIHMVHPVKRSVTIASAGRLIAPALGLPMPAMIGDAAVLGKRRGARGGPALRRVLEGDVDTRNRRRPPGTSREPPPRRLADRIGARPRILFVGINPSLRSAEVGHHFAGPGNPFWRLLAAAGLVPEGSGFAADRGLPALGLGITNIVPRATREAAELTPAEYAEGRRLLARKIARVRPAVVAFVGVTVYRRFF